MTYSKHPLFEKIAAPTGQMAAQAGHGVLGKLIRDPHLWAQAVAAGAGLAAGGIASAIGRVQETRAQAQAYKDMLDIHPQLKEREPVLVKRIYTSLHRANPHMAKDPMVAGAWVDTIVEAGGLDQTQASRALLDAVKDLSGIRAQTATARKNEPSNARSIASGMQAGVMHTFNRAKEVGKETEDLGVAHRQINDLQEKLKNKGVNESAKAVEELGRALGRLPQGANPQPIIEAIQRKYSSTPGGRLLAAVSR